MGKVVIGTVLVIGVCGWFAPADATGADRTAAQILKEIDAAVAPKLDADRARDAAYMRRFRTREREVRDRRDRLALELYKAAPDHERLPELLAERWSHKDERYRALFLEVDDVLAHTRNPKLKSEAIFIKARAKVKETRKDGSPNLALMDQFLKLRPDDPRGAELLQSAIDHTRVAALRSSLQERLTRDYPDSPQAARLNGPREPGEWIGKPFDLEFTDAITGAPVSIKKLAGKVVVIDFWATWCGPCVAEMPKMKELYASYRDRGVEFIGVSLDQPREQGGLESLKTFVKDRGITWPQYYQGDGWKSRFSSSWKINSIPRAFVVDQRGKLHSVDALGKLETIIPALLDKGLAARPPHRADVGHPAT
jgi:thiol-disulfide isomerase/thioredoxin